MNVDSGREAQGKDFPAAVQLFSQNHKVLETEKFGKCYEVSCWGGRQGGEEQLSKTWPITQLSVLGIFPRANSI